MLDILRTFSLSLPQTTEEPHFEKTSFRIRKKIFLSYDFSTRLACFKLSEKEQDLFSIIDPNLVFPVPNKWGKRGWTLAKIEALNEDVIRDLIRSAYNQVASEKLKLPPSYPHNSNE